MKKGLKKLAVVLCILSLTAGLTACAGGSKETGTGSDGASNEAAGADKDNTSNSDEGSTNETNSNEANSNETNSEETYAVVLKVLNSPFWQKMEAGIKAKAEELGVNVEIQAAGSEDDVEGQVTIFENLISKGYKGIAAAPLSADNLVNVISQANAQGILVADIDEKVNLEALQVAGGSVVSFVTTDNTAVGRMAGEFIAGRIGSGDVAVIEGKAGNASGEDRKNGAREAFEAAGLNIVDSQPADWDRTKAFDLATNLINKNPDLKAIYCCNDTMAMGAQEAVENSGKDIIVVGTDGNEDAIESVNAGKLTATIAQDPAGVGARSLELLVDAVRAGDKPGEKEIIFETIDAILITKE